MSSVLLKVARAIERGTLHKGVRVSGDRDMVHLSDRYISYNPRQDVARSQRTLRWVLKEYPGGAERVESTHMQALPRQMRSHTVKRIWIDHVRYMAGSVSCTYLREHRHTGEYKANTMIRDRRGNVQWLHTCCNQPLGVRAARELGLTP